MLAKVPAATNVPNVRSQNEWFPVTLIKNFATLGQTLDDTLPS